jgi:hypothetical protein
MYQLAFSITPLVNIFQQFNFPSCFAEYRIRTPAVRASRAIKISSTYYDVSDLRNFLINPVLQSPAWNPHFSIADYWRKISLPQKTSGAGGRARGQIPKFVFISQVMQHVARMCRRRPRSDQEPCVRN